MHTQIYWGVDSVLRVNAMRGSGSTSLPAGVDLFSHVQTYVHQPPAFWGRYLNRENSRFHTQTELPFLCSKIASIRRSAPEYSRYTCKILPVYNGAYVKRRSRFLPGPHARQHGADAADDAITIASEFGIPSGICIYADIERYRVSQDWFSGWFDQMYRSDYFGVGGIYGNARLEHGSCYVENSSGERVLRRFGWRENVDDAVNTYNRTAVAHRSPIQEGSEGEPGYSRRKQALTYVWTNRGSGANAGYENNAGHDFARGGEIPGGGHPIQAHFTPAAAEYSQFIRTTVWQYAGHVPLGCREGLVDFNLATEAGYGVMWDPMG